jgi:hypothetical protein
VHAVFQFKLVNGISKEEMGTEGTPISMESFAQRSRLTKIVSGSENGPAELCAQAVDLPTVKKAQQARTAGKRRIWQRRLDY